MLAVSDVSCSNLKGYFVGLPLEILWILLDSDFKFTHVPFGRARIALLGRYRSTVEHAKIFVIDP